MPGAARPRDVLAAAGRKADAIAAAEQALKLAHPNDPRPKQALEALKKARSSARIIMLTTYRSTSYLLSSLSAGAAGFVLKDISREELLAAIYAVSSGASMVDRDFLQSVLHSLESERDSKDLPLETLEPLTARETDILRLIVEGLTNQAIAQVLSPSPGTVKGYAHTILQKLGTNDRTQAAVKAIRLGLVQ